MMADMKADSYKDSALDLRKIGEKMNAMDQCINNLHFDWDDFAASMGDLAYSNQGNKIRNMTRVLCSYSKNFP